MVAIALFSPRPVAGAAGGTGIAPIGAVNHAVPLHRGDAVADRS
jgi:hypothetical protein